MNRLVSEVSSLVREQVENSPGGQEVRLIFHGPPLEILKSVFDELIASGPSVPTLLVVERLEDGRSNPRVGESGMCDQAHLLDLRNSPARADFLALVGPRAHSIRSITSTAIEFGVSAEKNGANARFDDWWEDAFVQILVGRAFAAAGVRDDQAKDAWELAKVAGRAFHDMDDEKSSRTLVWRFLSRLHSVVDVPTGLSIEARLSLAFGVPSTDDGKLSAKDQSSIISKIADAMADGFTAGIANAKAGASAEEAQSLDNFYEHIAARCNIPTNFERATPFFYSPAHLTELELAPPPAWWSALTCQKWAELLAEDSPEQDDLQFSCTNVLVEFEKGLPALVKDEVRFSFGTSSPRHYGTTVALKRAKSPICTVNLDAGEVGFVDHDVPSHNLQMRYEASAEGLKPAAIKVISLEHWQPGIFVACRQANKLSPPRKPRGKGSGLPNFEASLTLPGQGHYELLVFTASNVRLNDTAVGKPEDGAGATTEAGSELAIRRGDPAFQSFIPVDLDGDYLVEIGFERTDNTGKVSSEILSVSLTVDHVPEQACRGVLEQLILLNRKKVELGTKPVVRINWNELTAHLQDWIISKEAVADSFQPIVLADDFEDSWFRRPWGEGTGPIFSQSTFAQDPRPDFNEFNPPADFVEARKKIAERVRGEDNNSLFEAAELGEWYDRDPEFAATVEQYIDSYARWLSSSPDMASWVDVALVCPLDGPNGRTIVASPDAVLLSPMHPVRVGWHVMAQRVLREALEANKPCPAVSVFDPDCVPDVLTLGLRSPGGIEHVQFLSVENSTDYWSVLWNVQHLRRLPERSPKAPFGESLGISVGGISSSFTAGQVQRALDAVSTRLLPAKPKISLVVTGSKGISSSCNEGIVLWGHSRLGEGQDRNQLQPAGPRTLDVFDHRDPSQQPDEAIIANCSQDTRNRVRWFVRQPPKTKPDLGIISQLDITEPTAINVHGKSPLGFGGLLRHRIRRQLDNAFISETRQSRSTAAFTDALANKVAACITSLESQGSEGTGLCFALDVNAIREILKERDAHYVATSSAAVDPAAFLGGWVEDAYLWDYDLPSYSRRSGDTNGYYLLSKAKSADLDTLHRSVSRLPGCQDIDPDQLKDVLHEIARRGIPTVRGMSGENTGSTGDLGVFVAARLLQDNFRMNGDFDSLVPILEGEAEDDSTLCIIVPVDPFRKFIDELGKSIRKSIRKRESLSRPDLLAIGVRIHSSDVRIHLSPIEVKCYPDGTFRDVEPALNQAKNFSSLLEAMLPHKGQPSAWALGFQHLLLSLVNFGMRVYSQNPVVANRRELWARLHETIAAAILSGGDCITVDPRGRLLVVDKTPGSFPKDHDGDGFQETIHMSSEDAGIIVAGNPAKLYSLVKATVGRWELVPETERTDPKPHDGDAAAGAAGPSDSNGQTVHGPDYVDKPVPVGEGIPGQDEDGDSGRVKPTIAVATDDVGGPAVDPVGDSMGVRLEVGTTLDRFRREDLQLNLSDTRLTHLNIGVVGSMGTGKTTLLKSLIDQISASGRDNRGVAPNFLILDYKNDYNKADFVGDTGARVVLPHKLPLNLFDTRSIGQSNNPRLDRALFFIDALDKIYSGIGPKQRYNLKEAVQAAFDSCLPGGQPTLDCVLEAYKKVVDGKIDVPMSIMSDLVDMEIFAGSHSETLPFSEFLDGVVVISLGSLNDQFKNMLVAILLNMFFENMLKTEKKPFLGSDPQLRAIDSFLLVDEAHNIMRYEFDVLSKLLLQGREFGTGVILASQFLRQFKVNSTDYREPLLTWFIHQVPDITASDLSALGLSGNNTVAADRIRSLPRFECLYKSYDVPGEFIRGTKFFENRNGLTVKSFEEPNT